MNTVCLVGRLTAEPQKVQTQSGTSLTKFSLAVDHPFKKDETSFINITSFGKTADLAAQYLVKGQRASVTGYIQVRSFQDNQGNNRTATEVIADRVGFLAKPQGASNNTPGRDQEGNPVPYDRDPDGDLPF